MDTPRVLLDTDVVINWLVRETETISGKELWQSPYEIVRRAEDKALTALISLTTLLEIRFLLRRKKSFSSRQVEDDLSAISSIIDVVIPDELSLLKAEELKLIVSSSRGLGVLPEAEEDMIHRVLDLSEISAREVMVPRNDMVSISAASSLDDVLHTMIERQHSRLPVYDGTPEKIVGILHYKDLLPVWEERRSAIRTGRPSRAFRVARLMRRHLVVPETKPLSQMLEEFRQSRLHMAMVVDEFGTIVGMLTVKDVLEQVVGRIEGEHEEKTEPRLQETDEVELDGATRIRDMESEFGIEIPADAGFETLAGFLLYRLGEIPHAGESVEYQGRRYTVLTMDRNRIARVRIEKRPEASEGA